MLIFHGWQILVRTVLFQTCQNWSWMNNISEKSTVNTRTNRKCHSSLVTFDLWLRYMNLADEIPFSWHVALTKRFSLDFKWDLEFGSLFLALSFLFFTYLVHCFQFWKVWNTELFVLKSASHERSAFFVCNRLHWLPKDDCYARGSVGLVSKRKKKLLICPFFSFLILYRNY